MRDYSKKKRSFFCIIVYFLNLKISAIIEFKMANNHVFFVCYKNWYVPPCSTVFQKLPFLVFSTLFDLFVISFACLLKELKFQHLFSLFLSLSRSPQNVLLYPDSFWTLDSLGDAYPGFSHLFASRRWGRLRQIRWCRSGWRNWNGTTTCPTPSKYRANARRHSPWSKGIPSNDPFLSIHVRDHSTRLQSLHLLFSLCSLRGFWGFNQYHRLTLSRRNLIY